MSNQPHGRTAVYCKRASAPTDVPFSLDHVIEQALGVLDGGMAPLFKRQDYDLAAADLCERERKPDETAEAATVRLVKSGDRRLAALADAARCADSEAYKERVERQSDESVAKRFTEREQIWERITKRVVREDGETEEAALSRTLASDTEAAKLYEEYRTLG